MRRTTPLVIAMVVAGIVVLPAVVGLAQSSTSGSIRGTVTDANGGILPGATVIAISDALVSGRQVAIASGSGVYRFPSLPPGDYVLEGQLSGFKTVRHENVRLPLGQSLEIDLQLGDPEFSEEIVVVADSVRVSTVRTRWPPISTRPTSIASPSAAIRPAS